MLIVGVYHSAHSIVPNLHSTIVQRGKEPWAFGMETEALDSRCLGLKLGQHQASEGDT